MKCPVLTAWIAVAIGCLSAPTLSAGLINVNYLAQPGQRNVVDHSGTPLPDGNEVRVGYFVEGFDVAGNADDLSALNNAWVAYQSDDSNRFIRTLSDQPGRFSSVFSREAGSFTDKKVHLWIFKTVDDGALNPDLSNVVEYGLYSSTGSNWVFPSDALPISNSITVTSSEVDEAFFGATIADSLQLTLVSPPSSNYEEWVSAVFGGATPIAQRDPDDDPDNDGLENGMEYLTGSNPERPTFATVDSQSSNGETFVVTYLRSKTVPAGVETVEFSTDLVNWEEDPEAIISSNDWNPSQTLETVRVPLNGVDRLFARIVVNL